MQRDHHPAAIIEVVGLILDRFGFPPCLALAGPGSRVTPFDKDASRGSIRGRVYSVI